MQIKECISRLLDEKQKNISCRFPCRAIFVNSRQDYRQLMNELAAVCDRTVTADDLMPDADVMPQYDLLLEKVESDEWLLLPGVNEYLRLFRKSELRSERFRKLWHSILDAENKKRIIIPLWNCEAIWKDPAMGFCSDARQENYVFRIDELEDAAEKMRVQVFSASFEEYISQLNGKFSLMVGLREWYEHLCDLDGMPESYCLLTKQVRSIEPVVGDVTIRVIKDTYSFVRENLCDGAKLSQADCSDEMLRELMPEAIKGISLEKAILNCFNAVHFDGVSVMSGWEKMNIGQRDLLRLWYRLNPDGSYLCHCFSVSENDDALKEHLLSDVFDNVQYHGEWVEESKALLAALNLSRNADYFARLDGIPIFEARMDFLTADTRAERIYILRMVGQWLRQDAAQVYSSEKLENLYPALFAYLKRMPEGIDAVYSDYIADYKMYKLSNTIPAAEETHFRGIEPDRRPYRYALLQPYIGTSTIVLWIDALGFEYLSLLKWVLDEETCGTIKEAAIAQAALPTETIFNKQWEQMAVQYKKLDKIDKLAHRGVIDEPDYYACIEEQLSFFENLHTVIRELFKTYRRVVITGDHGTSRIAARMFHEKEGLIPPKDASVCSFGRYCRLEGETSTTYDTAVLVKDVYGNRYQVFRTYDHFKSSGCATGTTAENILYGEVHGGASPEEMIVPVVVFDSNRELPLTAKWEKSKVRLKKKQLNAVLNFSRAVVDLQVTIGNHVAACETDDEVMWTITVKGIAPDTYNAHIVADGQIVAGIDPLIVTSALEG